MKQRIITSIVLITLFIPPLIIGGLPLRILMFSLCAIASYEVVSLNKKASPKFLSVVIFISVVIMYNIYPDYYLPAVTIFLLSLFLVLLINDKYSVVDIVIIFVISIILTLACKGIANAYMIRKLMMLQITIATYMTDMGAYFTGYFFGKHKLNERISPKKTWEGAIGGYAFGLISSFVFGYYYLNDLDITFIALNSLFIPLVSQIGDLTFSAIKRSYDVKDFGSIFPGHGGVLDRIDSLLFSLMIFNAILTIFLGPQAIY